jgi:hypothetical protein
MGEACSAHVGDEKCTRVLLGIPEEKRPLGRPKHRWNDVKIDHTGWRGRDSSGSLPGPVAGSCEYGKFN